ncbi:MAG: TPM domain-containing protein, partial [Candidatus Poseidoniales archaeon]|nr:TPM domain-containing protein [Candidatus Poseidoniales archaeon]
MTMTQFNMNKGFLTVTVLFILLLSSISVNAANVPPEPTEEGIWVIDDAGLLVQGQLNYLNEKCNSIYLETGTPVVILVIESYESQDAPDWWGMEEYARFAFDEYAINDDRNEDKAILIFISELDRQFWIELGGGYLGDGLDEYVQSIFDNDVRPWLAEDLWFDGLDAAVEGLRPILEEGEITIP